MAKNPSFRPDFGPYGLNLEPKIFFADFTTAGTLLQAIIECNFKEN